MQNNWPILKSKLALQLCFVALLIYTCLLPFQPKFPPITSGIVAFWLVYILSFTRDRWAKILSSTYVKIWLAYYLLLLIGLLYTSNPDEAGKDIVLKITLILWPMGFASWSEPILKYRTKILAVFASVTLISTSVTLLAGLYFWLQSDATAGRIFMFLNIWDTLPNHYIAMYASFSIFILATLYADKHLKFVWALLGSFILLVFIAFVSVRIQLLALPVAAILFLIFQKTNPFIKKRLWQFSISTFVLIALLAVVVPSSRHRIIETVDEFKSIDGMVNSKQTNHRVFLWHYGKQVIAENIWFGTGTGAADDALNVKLKDCEAKFWDGKNNYYLYDSRYNFHNAYLQAFATHGIFGILIFISLFVYPFVKKGKNITGLQAAFLGICAISFITESMLERQAGVLFFGFFYSLLFIPKVSKSGK